MKTLFALSGNTCAYSRCEVVLTDPAWKEVNADIAHICGEAPTAARYDVTMSPRDRVAFENLLLLCPSHHRLVDRLAPEQHSVELLREMKERHESRATEDGFEWTTDRALHLFASIAIGSIAANVVLAGDEAVVEEDLDGEADRTPSLADAEILRVLRAGHDGRQLDYELAVLSRLVGRTDRRPAPESGVTPVMVVGVEESVKGSGAFGV